MRYLPLSLLAASLLAFMGCNSNSSRIYAEKSLETTATTQVSYKLVAVNPVESGSSTVLRATFATSNLPVSNLCQAGTCTCQITWSEPVSNGSVISRSATSSVSQVQSFVMECPAPDAYKDISETTPISFRILPASQNSQKFEVPYFVFSKSAIPDQGAFTDYQGRPFDNVYRYSCYEHFRRGTSILNMSYTDTRNGSSGGGSVSRTSLSATKFCFAQTSADNTISYPSGCDKPEMQDSKTHSAQSYYYHLFIRSGEIGAINTSNSRYMCPTVRDPATNTNKYYPLDSTFALALAKSPDYPVPVEGPSKLGGPGDPITQNKGCSDTQSSGSGSNSETMIFKSCLGFAARPNSQGVCPKIQDASGNPIQTYRLRRYVAMYPIQFDASGGMIDGLSPAIDTVYVLDRPVGPPTSTGEQDTMNGPKPCPIAYFNDGVIPSQYCPGGIPACYLGTNNPQWEGKNVDGTRFPDEDKISTSQSPGRCSAALPLIGPDRNKLMVTFGTVNASNPNPKLQKTYIRPQNPWSPRYEEDTDFLACAPPSSDYVDAPIHTFKIDSQTYGYCAETTPTHRETMPIELATSHIRSGAQGGNEHCNPGQRCHREVNYSGFSTLPWKNFPLLAPTPDIELALRYNPSYQCAITYDRRATSTQNAKLGLSPTQGCCATASYSRDLVGFHVEPDLKCTRPSY